MPPNTVEGVKTYGERTVTKNYVIVVICVANGLNSDG